MLGRWLRSSGRRGIAVVIAIPALAFFIGILPASSDAQVVVGTVRMPDGQPVALAHVFAIDSVSDVTTAVGVMTDSEGRFRLWLGSRRAALLGVRRIGFTPEPARTLDWSHGDTLRVDVVLRAIPFQLPTVYAGTGVCQPLSELSRDHPVRELWDAATATIAAREAFLSEYAYTLDLSHTNSKFRADTIHYTYSDTTIIVSPPRAPLAPDRLSKPLGTFKRTGLFRRGWEVRFQSPEDRVILHPDFAKRFCVNDRVFAGESDMVELHFHEQGPSRKNVQVGGVFFFRPGIAGPSRVEWRYVLDGVEVARAEHVFELIDVDGTAVPLTTANIVEYTGRRTKRSEVKTTSVRFRYSRFVRVESRSH